MKKITFLGASSDIVTGSSYLVSDNQGYGVLVDLGMFQGSEEVDKLNYQPLAFDAREVHSVILTHAHLDHVGRLAMLVRNGFKGRIYMTAATKELAEVVMLDSAKIALHDESKPILYSKDDVFATMELIDVVDYHETFEIADIKVELRDAGHILGSASVLMNDGQKKLIFSGDLGNSPEEIVRATEYFEEGDFVVMESTYGDKTHPHDNPNETIQNEINEVENSGGTLLIPSFSIERTQVLLHKIDHMKKTGAVKPDTLVYLDSPMGLKATDIYKSYPELYNQEMTDHVKNDEPFDFPGLVVIDRVKDSKKIAQNRQPKVIIAGSGMMAGGRILNHALNYLDREDTRLLIVGFQAEGTHGREIIEGARSLKIYGKTVQMNAHLTELYSMSAHADQPKLLEWLGKTKGVEKVFLTHGEKQQRDILSEKIHSDLNIRNVEKPELKQAFSLEK